MSNPKTSPIAVIGFSETASPLEPLWPATHRALLPIAGKPLIVHLIEQLADAGIRHVRIAGSIQQYAVRNRLGNGREWGITVRYSDLHGIDLRAECIAAESKCLYLLGDHLLDANFTAIANGTPCPGAANITDDEAGLWQLEDGELIGRSLQLASGEAVYENPLENVADYHNANLRAIRGLLPRLNLPGSAIHRTAVADWKTHIAADVCLGKNVFVGKHCRIRSLARLEGNCILSNGVVVDRGVQLQNVSVLPNCFVGQTMTMRDAVLGANGFLSLDGKFRAVSQHQLLGASRDNHETTTGIPSLFAAGNFAT